jgi:hypothetical protein
MNGGIATIGCPVERSSTLALSAPSPLHQGATLAPISPAPGFAGLDNRWRLSLHNA